MSRRSARSTWSGASCGLWLAAALLAGCDVGLQAGAGIGSPGDPSGDLGFSVAASGLPCDVAAVFELRCVSCHGHPLTSAAPMPLTTIAEIKTASPTYPGSDYAQRSVVRIQAGTMPIGGGMPASEIKTIADLKGRKIGVSAPGSATHMFVLQLLAKAGLKAGDVSTIGVGTTQTALSAFERGDIDALSLFDPIMIDLEQRGLATVLADARNTAGSTAIFGGPYASGSLYGDTGWLDKNPDAVRGAAAAILEAVTFLKNAAPREALESLEKGMCFLGAPVCDAGFAQNREAFQHNGRITLEQAQTVRRMLDSFNPEIAAAKIDLSATFTARFLAG